VKLTTNFSFEELTHSDTAIRNGIDNTPPDHLLPNLMVLAEGSERVRYVLGRRVLTSSGYRCEELERIICWKDFIGWCERHGRNVADPQAWADYFARKSHPKGLSLDFTSPEFGTPAQIVAALVKNKEFVNFEQCIEEGKWVHVAFPASGIGRGEVLTARFDSNGRAHYTQVLG
jgi:hypothetical protein